MCRWRPDSLALRSTTRVRLASLVNGLTLRTYNDGFGLSEIAIDFAVCVQMHDRTGYETKEPHLTWRSPSARLGPIIAVRYPAAVTARMGMS
jgi:hypothetical protein